MICTAENGNIMQGRKFAKTLTVREDAIYQDIKLLIFVQTVTVNFLVRGGAKEAYGI